MPTPPGTPAPSSSQPHPKPQHDDLAPSHLTPSRPTVLSTRSLTPTTSLTIPNLFAQATKRTRTKPSISSLNSDTPSSGSTGDGGEGMLLQAHGEEEHGEGFGIGTGKEGNAGPKVHVQAMENVDKEGEDGEGSDSDDSDGPPPWVRADPTPPTSVIDKGKGKPKFPTTGLSPTDAPGPSASLIKLNQVAASQTLLREQLLKSGPASKPSTSRRKSVSAHPPAASKPPSIESTVTPTTLSRRKYYIITSAGKPVWSSEDDNEDVDVTGQAGVMQAIVSIFADEGDKLKYLDAGDVRIAVMIKPPLYYFAVSDWGEPKSVLSLHLDHLHLLILSLLSHTQLQRIFSHRPSHDLRRSLHGTTQFFNGLTQTLQWDFSILMGSLEVWRGAKAVRERIGRLVTPEGVGEGEVGKDLLYALVVKGGKVVTLVRPKRHSVHPSDLHILLSTIMSSPSLLTSESWLPICLPKYNATGFLHTYVSFPFPPDPTLGLIFVSGDREGFFKLKEWAEDIGENMKSDTVVTSPDWEADYEDKVNRQRLVTIYQRCYDLLHARSSEGRVPAKFTYIRNEHEGIVAWMTSEYELYMAVSPMLSKSAAVAAAHAVSKWVKNEEQKLFLIGAPSF